jgi:hypothetical protein
MGVQKHILSPLISRVRNIERAGDMLCNHVADQYTIVSTKKPVNQNTQSLIAPQGDYELVGDVSGITHDIYIDVKGAELQLLQQQTTGKITTSIGVPPAPYTSLKSVELDLAGVKFFRGSHFGECVKDARFYDPGTEFSPMYWDVSSEGLTAWFGLVSTLMQSQQRTIYVDDLYDRSYVDGSRRYYSQRAVISLSTAILSGVGGQMLHTLQAFLVFTVFDWTSGSSQDIALFALMPSMNKSFVVTTSVPLSIHGYSLLLLPLLSTTNPLLPLGMLTIYEDYSNS